MEVTLTLIVLFTGADAAYHCRGGIRWAAIACWTLVCDCGRVLRRAIVWYVDNSVIKVERDDGTLYIAAMGMATFVPKETAPQSEEPWGYGYDG
jgi:hypothetical protein